MSVRVPALQAATGAPTVGFRHSALAAFDPDIKLDNGGTIAGMLALHTPGHASDHLCFALAGAERRQSAVQRRSCDVLVHQCRQPAGR